MMRDTDKADGDELSLWDSDRFWIAAGVALLGVTVWCKRDTLLAGLVPYGLTEPKRIPVYGDPARPWTPTGWHIQPGPHTITTTGWITLTVAVLGLTALLFCVRGAVGWSQWRRGGGIDAIPTIPVFAAASVVGAAAFVGMLVSAPGVLWMAAGTAVGSAAAVWLLGRRVAERYRTLAAFARRADQVLGYGHPAVGRVRVRGWRATGAGEACPVRIVARCGPGWQNLPHEVAALDRYARETGWVSYDWRYDALEKCVIGAAAFEDGDHAGA